jgi:hypothetical protein
MDEFLVMTELEQLADTLKARYLDLMNQRRYETALMTAEELKRVNHRIQRLWGAISE